MPRSGPSDTNPDIAARLIAAHRRMSPQEKIQRVLACNAAGDAMAIAGLRARHPSLSADELRLRLAALRLGRQAMIDAFGWDPDAPPADG
jgi:hypothetical protein